MALGVGDIVRTSVNFTLPNGVQYQNIFHHIFDGIGGISDAAVTADIAAWAETMYGEIITLVGIGTTPVLSFVDQVEFVVDNWEVVANIGTFTIAFAPASIEDVLPNQSSTFITFKTARPKSVGRKFLFPPIETIQDAGILTGGAITDYVAWADDAVNDIVLDVVNELHPGVVRTGVNDFLGFTVAIVTNLLGSQRRRRPGYGA